MARLWWEETKRLSTGYRRGRGILRVTGGGVEGGSRWTILLNNKLPTLTPPLLPLPWPHAMTATSKRKMGCPVTKRRDSSLKLFILTTCGSYVHTKYFANTLVALFLTLARVKYVFVSLFLVRLVHATCGYVGPGRHTCSTLGSGRSRAHGQDCLPGAWQHSPASVWISDLGGVNEYFSVIAPVWFWLTKLYKDSHACHLQEAGNSFPPRQLGAFGSSGSAVH